MDSLISVTVILSVILELARYFLGVNFYIYIELCPVVILAIQQQAQCDATPKKAICK